MIRPPAPALVERFRRDLAVLTGEAPAGSRPLALAVSGGPDSMAMLVVAAAAWPGAVIAATVDHGLRQASAGEAEMVAAYCAALGVPHATLAVETPLTGASIQAQAREARYGLLLDWAAAHSASGLLTAHHADDQAETLLMRLLRGSGVAGLAGVRKSRIPVDGNVLILRPMLGWRRSELRAVMEATATPFVDDPSNRDSAFDRVRIRQLLDRTPDLDPLALAQSAANLAEAEDALRQIAAREWERRREIDGATVSIDMADLPRELRRRLVRRAIGKVRDSAAITAPEWSDAANIEHLLAALEAGNGAAQAGVMAQVRHHRWEFREAPPRRSH